MYINKLFHVEVPNDGKVFKVIGNQGETLIYKVAESDGKDAKPVIIGQLVPDSDTECMWPTESYTEIYGTSNFRIASPCIEYGLTYIVDKLSRDIGVYQLVSDIFGERADAIMAIIAWVICEGPQDIGYLEVWQDQAFVPDVEYALTVDVAIEIFDSISNDEIELFFQRWTEINHNPENGFCFDIPIVAHSASDETDDHMLMFCHERTKMPLFFCTYYDRSSESESKEQIAAEASALGMPANTQILDVSEKRLNSVEDGFAFRIPGAMEESLDFVLDLIDRGGFEMFPAGEWQYALVNSEYKGSSGKIALVFPKKLGSADYFSNAISVTERLLKEFRSNSLGKSRKATSAAIEKAKKIIEKRGYLAYFTTEDWTTLEILERYNAKDIISSVFPVVRRKYSEPVCFHQGYKFVSFAASIILWHMNSKLLGTGFSMQEAFRDLKHILVIGDGTNFFIRYILGPRQEKLLEIFEVNVAKFLKIKQPLRAYEP
ncbi:MAG: hypothetical protein LBT59_28910 [Clostridiales bacterium]|nr:hypothetical protein [Clostridiales bacterium]